MKKVEIIVILALLVGCSPGVNTPVPDIKLSSKPVITASSIPSVIPKIEPSVKVSEKPKDGTGKIQQDGEPSNAPSTEPTVSPSPTPIPSPSYIPGNDRPPPNPKFNQAYPVKEGIRVAAISVFFKDPPKIRYNPDIKELVSLAFVDVTNINNLMKKYNVKTNIPYAARGKTEEELEKQEKQMEKTFGVDMPNEASIYYLYTESDNPINVKEFIETLRLDPLVLNANEDTGSTPD